MAVEFKLPELGENIEVADVVNVLVAEGHVVQPGQTLMELETDKAVVELPAEHAGRIIKLHVKAGDRVPVGSVLLTIDATETAAAEPPPATPSEPEPQPEPAPEPEQPAAVEPPAQRTPPAPATEAPAEPTPQPATPAAIDPAAKRRPAPASPAVRKQARELGVDLHQVSGTGSGGRITAEDVQKYVRDLASAAMAGTLATPGAPPLPDFAQWGPIERVPMGGIRRKTAEAMAVAWRNVPHVTQFDSADVTELEAVRKRYGANRKEGQPKVTMTILIAKAVVSLLKEFPHFNASIDPVAGQMIHKQYYNLGIAVDTEHGLLVPVIRDADRKNILQLATEVEQLAELARSRKIDIEQLRGGTFTITNLGGIAGTAFTPIVNHPEVAILGVSRSRIEPAYVDGQWEPRLMLPLSLSYDHRAIDGADGARFVKRLVQILSDPMQLMLEA